MSPEPAADVDVWFEGFRWTEAVVMQAERLSEALAEFQRAMLDADMRYRLSVDDSEPSREWRESYDAESEIGMRPVRVPSWSLDMQVANEADFLVLSIRNVVRALARLPEDRRPTMSGTDILTDLRNVAEHFDEIGGWSAERLARRHPNVSQSTLAGNGREIWIGGADGVPLSRILAWTARARQALAGALESSSVSVPDDLLASRVEGDDALPWPSDRLHFGWWIPIPNESEWPRDAMPEEIAQVLAQRFANVRARDGAD